MAARNLYRTCRGGMPSCRRLRQAAARTGRWGHRPLQGAPKNDTAPVGAAIGRPQPTDSHPGTPPAPHPGLPLRGAGMAQSAMTERCYRSALWGSLRESQLPQHLSSKAGWRILRAKALELPAKAGSSRILQSVALRAPPPLKGRLCAACAARVDGDIDPYNLCSLALKHHKLWPQKKT